MSYTIQQQKILAIVPKITGGFSMPCDVFLIHLIVGDHKKKRANPMLRALMGVSFFGLCDSFGWFLSTWAIPQGQFAFATGTVGSCNFQGVLTQIVIGAPLYNCALAYFFYEVIVNDRPQESMLRLEKIFHVGIISFAILTAILLLALGIYNPNGVVCCIEGYPAGCGNSVYKPEPDAVACERGDWAWVYGMVLFYIPVWCCILLIIFFNVSIWIKLRNTTEGRWFATQSMLYALAFCATWAPSTIWSAVGWNNGGGFGLSFASAFFEPLAGVWNLSIFLRNRHSVRNKIWNFLCCHRNKLVEHDSKSDDIEGAPRKQSMIKKKVSQAGTEESAAFSDKKKKRKSSMSKSSHSGAHSTHKKKKKRASHVVPSHTDMHLSKQKSGIVDSNSSHNDGPDLALLRSAKGERIKKSVRIETAGVIDVFDEEHEDEHDDPECGIDSTGAGIGTDRVEI